MVYFYPKIVIEVRFPHAQVSTTDKDLSAENKIIRLQYHIDSEEDLRFYSQVFKEQTLYPSNAKTITRLIITCPYTNCNAKYRCWNTTNSINCPACIYRESQ